MRNKKLFLIGSRASPLAKEQTRIFIKQLKKTGICNIKTKYILSKGDKFSSKKFKNFGGKALFTGDLDDLVLKGEIDIAIHSSKDIPAKIHKELVISAFLKREDVRDVLITKNYKIRKIEDLPKGITLGSSSPRRISYIKHYRPDIVIKGLRGNIDTRIKKVYEGKVYATILAKAGINRLKEKKYDINLQNIPISKILPAAGQGAIAVIQRKDNYDLRKVMKLIDDKNTRLTVLTERELIKGINGDCFTPVGVLAKIKKNTMQLKIRLFSSSGKDFIDKTRSTELKLAEKMGHHCAEEILSEIDFKFSK